MDNSGLFLRKLATVPGVSQPFLSQITSGKRPLLEALKRKVEALGAYHLLIGRKHISDSTKEGTESIANFGPNQIGAGGGIRTPDFLLGKQTLYH